MKVNKNKLRRLRHLKIKKIHLLLLYFHLRYKICYDLQMLQKIRIKMSFIVDHRLHRDPFYFEKVLISARFCIGNFNVQYIKAISSKGKRFIFIITLYEH